MLTVMTWYWIQPNGRAAYKPEHVRIWADMVRRNLTIPHRLAVVTDVPGDYGDLIVIDPPRDFENVRIPTWGEDKPQCLRRLAMFAPDARKRFGDRFVSMDMDCVVSGSLDPLFDRNDDFVMYRGTHERRPYNGSMVMMTAGARPQVYTEFTPEGAAKAGRDYIGSDQAWISRTLGPGEATWGVDDGVHAWGSRLNRGEPRLTFFLGNPKPWDLVLAGDATVQQHYRRSPGGKALILGYAPSVWTEAEAALAADDYDAVIASPEAAEHWPDVLAVGRTDGECETVARMHGYDDFVFCGRSTPIPGDLNGIGGHGAGEAPLARHVGH